MERPLTPDSTSWTPEQARKAGADVAHALLGTCSYILAELEKLDLPDGLQDDSTFCGALDDAVAECECCGWWVEAGDVGEHDGMTQVCGECRDE